PELTEARFVPDPFSRTPGARLYRTGDLGRHLPNGALEFLGRCDDQVKLRGHRIELGEVESTLLQHPGVRQAVAAVREVAPGDQRLIAYVVADDDVDKEALRADLKNHLPEYMVPWSCEALERLPLSPSGKVDRKM